MTFIMMMIELLLLLWVGEEISRYRPTENYLEQNWSNFETEILKAEFVRMK